MEALMLLGAVVGIPLVLALFVIDRLSRETPAYRDDEHVLAAAGIFWDRPAGVTRPVRRHERAIAGEPDRDMEPTVVCPDAPAGAGLLGSIPAMLGVTAPAEP